VTLCISAQSKTQLWCTGQSVLGNKKTMRAQRKPNLRLKSDKSLVMTAIFSASKTKEYCLGLTIRYSYYDSVVNMLTTTQVFTSIRRHTLTWAWEAGDLKYVSARIFDHSKPETVKVTGIQGKFTVSDLECCTGTLKLFHFQKELNLPMRQRDENSEEDEILHTC